MYIIYTNIYILYVYVCVYIQLACMLYLEKNIVACVIAMSMLFPIGLTSGYDTYAGIYVYIHICIRIYISPIVNYIPM